MDTFDYILLAIALVACIATIIRITYFPNSFIDTDADDEIFDKRTVRQMRGDWDEDK